MRVRREPGDLSRIGTLPNALSVSRVAFVGAFVYLLFPQHARVLSTVVLAIGATTDFADGYLARRLGQVTTLGKILDPTADRILLGTAISSMVVFGAIPVWLAAVVLSREALVAGSVLLLASRGMPRIDVSTLGKAATFGLMVCFPLLLLGHGDGSWARAITISAWVVVIPSLILSISSAIGYVPTVRSALQNRRDLKQLEVEETR